MKDSLLQTIWDQVSNVFLCKRTSFLPHFHFLFNSWPSRCNSWLYSPRFMSTALSYKHTRTPKNTPTHTHTNTPANTRTPKHTHTHTHTQTRTLANTRTPKHTHTRKHTHTHKHKHTHTRTPKHTHILHYFCLHPQIAFQKASLLMQLWQPHE